MNGIEVKFVINAWPSISLNFEGHLGALNYKTNTFFVPFKEFYGVFYSTIF